MWWWGHGFDRAAPRSHTASLLGEGQLSPLMYNEASKHHGRQRDNQAEARGLLLLLMMVRTNSSDADSSPSVTVTVMLCVPYAR